MVTKYHFIGSLALWNYAFASTFVLFGELIVTRAPQGNASTAAVAASTNATERHKSGVLNKAKLSLADLDNLKKCGASVQVHFDASHLLPEKDLHLEMEIWNMNLDRILKLRNDHLRTFDKFFSFTRAIPDEGQRLKFEVMAFNSELLTRSKKRHEIEKAKAHVKGGKIYGMVRGIWQI